MQLTSMPVAQYIGPHRPWINRQKKEIEKKERKLTVALATLAVNDIYALFNLALFLKSYFYNKFFDDSRV